jgi:putative sterol carrier protein
VRPHFKRGFLHQDRAVFQFTFKTAEPFHLVVELNAFEFMEGIHQHPHVTLFIESHQTAYQLLTGSMDGMHAFMEGSYRSDGNIVLSQLLLYLFKPDDPTEFYQVKD